jgi:Sigma-70, region 4
MSSFDVRVFAIRRRPGRRVFEVRWRVAGHDKSRSFITRARQLSARSWPPPRWPAAPTTYARPLGLVFACCHPALALEVRIAMTLRYVAGLTTREIAASFLLPEPTLAQRLVRAGQKIREAGIRFARNYSAAAARLAASSASPGRGARSLPRTWAGHQTIARSCRAGPRAQFARVAGSPNRGRVLGSKRVMAEIWVPERVRTISPTV